MLRGELRAFRSTQVWLALGVAMLGGGGLFATFSYIAPMMTNVAGYAPSSVTLILVLFGLGMTAGNLLGARLADRALMPTLYGALALQAGVAALFMITAHGKVAAAVTVFLFAAASFAVVPALQSRIVAEAGNAPNVASGANQAAFNIANALGAWLGGLALSAGLGYTAPNAVATGLPLDLAGLSIAVSSGLLEHRTRARARAPIDEAPIAPADLKTGELARPPPRPGNSGGP
ncbi:putative MFS family arabinose efflux permease [Streptacidiphilus sp. MAP12-20]|uniref:MFS transporter n=1 Tax=Streptacidiphilus sp. MAP12-20 TaxID=3156299 RepID=UPI0035161370